jgi:hypothetical protein
MFSLTALGFMLALVVVGMAQMKADRPATYYSNGVMSNRFRFVAITGDYTVGYAGAGVRAFGVNLDTSDLAGRGILIATCGSGPTVKIEAGAAFAAGALLAPDASGRAVTAAGAAPFSARAIQAATAIGDLVECELVDGTA